VLENILLAVEQPFRLTATSAISNTFFIGRANGRIMVFSR
jgi:hypothetical protein